MDTKKVFFILASLILVGLSGCGEDEASPAAVQSSQPAAQTATSQPAAQETASSDPNAVYRELEITPPGDERCFLSPCDCVCYPIPNVPKTAMKATCASDCREEMGITGCRFTNYQCVTTK